MQKEIENEANEHPVRDTLHIDDDDEITALEEIITRELKDLSVQYTDDEDAHEELQPLITSLLVPFPVVVNDRATNNLEHKASGNSQAKKVSRLRNHIPMTQPVINK